MGMYGTRFKLSTGDIFSTRRSQQPLTMVAYHHPAAFEESSQPIQFLASSARPLPISACLIDSYSMLSRYAGAKQETCLLYSRTHSSTALRSEKRVPEKLAFCRAVPTSSPTSEDTLLFDLVVLPGGDYSLFSTIWCFST